MSTPAPTFSIVMPAFNAERTVAAAIRSVLAQSRADFELLVVDNGSTDRTRDVIRPFETDPRVVVISLGENRGPSAARNLALEQARGRFLSLLDSDDLYLPTYLDDVADTLVRNPDAGFAFPDAWVLDGRSGRVRKTCTLADYARPDADPAAWLRQLVSYNVVHYMAMIPRDVLAVVGRFDERLQAAMDYELWLRIAAGGYPAVRIDRPLGVYRVTPGSITSRRRLVTSSLCELYRIVAEEYEVDEDVRLLANRQLRRTTIAWEALGHEGSWGARLRRARGRSLAVLAPGRRAWRNQRNWYPSPPAELDDFLRSVGGT